MKKIVVILFITFFFSTLSFPKVFDISYSKRGLSNCDRVDVELWAKTDTVYNGLYIWDFGDGEKFIVNDNRTVEHHYLRIGRYTVTLTYIYNNDTTIIVKKNLFSVTKNFPVASFSLDTQDTILYAPFTAKFINKSTHGDGDSLFYLWKFWKQRGYLNDTSSQTNPTLECTKPDEYLVNLIVTDNFGCIVSHDTTLIVKDIDQKNEIPYTDNCLSKKNKNAFYPFPYIEYIGYHLCNNSIEVSGLLSDDCCSKKTITYHKEDYIIYIYQYYTGGICTCNCLFPFSFTIPDIHDDSVYLDFAENIYKIYNCSLQQIKNQSSPYSSFTFQNPVSNFIPLKNISNPNTIISIFDILGKQVFSATSVSIKSGIDVSALNNGLYIIRYSTPYSSSAFKLIISH